MENLPNRNAQMQNSKNSWTDQEIDKLGRALAFCFKNSDQYGADLNLKSRLDAFKFTLQDDFTVEQILMALREHMKRSTEMFKPAHVSDIIAPAKPKVSHAEFIHAKDQWAKEGYPQFSYYHMIVMEYEKENADDRAKAEKIEDENILKIVQQSVKRIG